MSADCVVIDGTDAVLGRLASSVSKRLLRGERITVINVEKIVITGNPKRTEKLFLERRSRGSPQHGPYYPKSPDAIFRRIVRGMLPYKKAKGIDALSRFKAVVGNGGVSGE